MITSIWCHVTEHLLKKRIFSFGNCPNYPPPLPLHPIWASCTTFSIAKNVDLCGIHKVNFAWPHTAGRLAPQMLRYWVEPAGSSWWYLIFLRPHLPHCWWENSHSDIIHISLFMEGLQKCWTRGGRRKYLTWKAVQSSEHSHLWKSVGQDLSPLFRQ